MRSLILLLTLGTTVGAMAQSVIYRSYGEYAENMGEPVDGTIDVVPDMGRFVVKYVKDGRKKHIASRKVWGFRNNGFLYRIEPEAHLPVRLMAQGAVYYWENGIAHLRIQRDSTEAASFEYGHASYLSREVQSTIVPAIFTADDTKSSSAKFREAWPAYADLLKCIGEGADMDSVRQCVVNYAVAVEEGKVAGP
ncbi:MAG: hypothetical protein K8H89_08815 [Flavobacteriales bacterium]|jgi:hypothetical protein|nr:hypothetical protein [Flavobacteriales bacterium]MCB0759051.1 hypothetical protein [Flavobacteriales bacterium]